MRSEVSPLIWNNNCPIIKMPIYSSHTSTCNSGIPDTICQSLDRHTLKGYIMEPGRKLCPSSLATKQFVNWNSKRLFIYCSCFVVSTIKMWHDIVSSSRFSEQCPMWNNNSLLTVKLSYIHYFAK